MANRDIAGLLTGIPSGGIDPMAKLTPQQMRAQIVSGAQQQVGSALRGMFGGDRRTPQEKMLQESVEKKKADEDKLTEDALLVANSLPSEYSQLAEAIRRGVKGALGKGIEILGRKQTEVKQPKGEKPTATDITAAKKALSLAGEEAKGGEAFGFLGTDWNDAWNNQTEAAKDLLATQVAEVTNKLIKPPASLDLSEARKLAIQKMYTDNLTETGLFEWRKGESRLMNADEIAEKQKKDLEARLAKPEYK